MSAQHTPGPWAVEEPMDHELWIVEAGKEAHEWRVIAGCPWPDERTDIPRKQVQANARLIAEAPAMLALLKEVREFIDDCPSYDGAATNNLDSRIALLIDQLEGR